MQCPRPFLPFRPLNPRGLLIGFVTLLPMPCCQTRLHFHAPGGVAKLLRSARLPVCRRLCLPLPPTPCQCRCRGGSLDRLADHQSARATSYVLAVPALCRGRSTGCAPCAAGDQVEPSRTASRSSPTGSRCGMRPSSRLMPLSCCPSPSKGRSCQTETARCDTYPDLP